MLGLSRSRSVRLVRAFSALLGVLAGGLLACSHAVDDTRAAWLVNGLTEDNQALATRAAGEPSPFRELVLGKYKKMSLSAYAFFRGTNAQFMRDVGEGEAVLELPLEAAAQGVWLIGDPHPENLGSYQNASGELTVDYNDFDAAMFGPFYLDLWRMLQGFWLIAKLNPAVYDAASTQALLAKAASAYRAEIARRAQNQAPRPVHAGESVIFDDLLKRAKRDGDSREALLEATEVVAGQRRFKRGKIEADEAEGVFGEAYFDVSPATRARFEAGLMAYRASLLKPPPAAQFRLKDIVRKLGSGISSYPNRRYYLLLEGETEASDDDLLIEAKEVLDPPKIPRFQPSVTPRQRSQAERVVVAQRALQASPENDAWLGWMGEGVESYRLRNRRKYQKGIKLSRIQKKLKKGSWDKGDLETFAELAARLLADAHTARPTLSGAPAAPAILASLPRDGEAAWIAATEAYGQRILADYALFQTWLQSLQPPSKDGK